MTDPRTVRLGIIVPSSNTALEPLINAMIADINRVLSDINLTVHYSRFRVVTISNSAASATQFELPKMLAAAQLLADANVHVISWSGTSAGWLGIDRDRQLCAQIERQLLIPATTATLSLIDIMNRLDNPPLGLVTPYLPEMNEQIRQVFAAEGITIVPDDQHLSITDNHEIAKLSSDQFEKMIQTLIQKQRDIRTVTTFCTNLTAASYAATWEQDGNERNLMVLDTVATTVWGLLQRVGINASNLGLAEKWGKIFNIPTT